MTRLASAVSSSMSGIGTPASPGTKRMPVRADLLTRRGAYVMGRNLFGPIRSRSSTHLTRHTSDTASLADRSAYACPSHAIGLCLGITHQRPELQPEPRLAPPGYKLTPGNCVPLALAFPEHHEKRCRIGR